MLPLLPADPSELMAISDGSEMATVMPEAASPDWPGP